MSFRIDHYVHNSKDDSVIAAIADLKEIIMGTFAEFAGKLDQLTVKTEKIVAEVQAGIAALKLAIEAAGNSTPEVDAAMLRLEGALQVADDIHQDVVV